MLLGVPLALVSPLIVKLIIDRAAEGAGGAELTRWSLVLVVLTLLSVVFGIVVGYCSRLFHNKVACDLRRRLYLHLQGLSLSFHQEHETGYLLARQTDDVDNLDGVMADTLGRGVIEVLKALGFLVMLVMLEPRLAAGGCVLLAVVLGIQVAVSRPLRARNRDVQEQRSQLHRTLHQGISGQALVAGTASEKREARRFLRSLHGWVRTALRRDLFALWTDHVTFLVTGVAPTLIILGGAWMISRDELSVGGLFAFFMYLVQLAAAAAAVAGLNPAVQSSLASLERVFEVLDAAPEVVERPGARPVRVLQGEVTFEGVSFAYKGRDLVLRDIHLEVPARTRVALVGPSGAGKSTLVHLLPRFHDPTEGRVLVDGMDLRDLRLRDLRQRIGIVPQDVFLFDRTVLENIAYGVPEADRGRVVEAAAAANARSFVEALPDGFDTLVGERGVRLSAGQRQRLAIAREVLRDPDLLILDEATSALDSESERLIQEALERLLADRTAFVIAHRLSTVMGAGLILVMDQGRVVERGRHEELLEAGGLYARLHALQFHGAGLREEGA